MSDCRHILVTTYHRRWYWPFSRVHEIRCWRCDVTIREI